MNAAPVDDPGKSSLESAADVFKWTTGAAAGSLVFSLNLVANFPSYDNLTRLCAVVAWAFLGLSIIGGTMTQLTLPVLLADKNYDLEAPSLVWPARVQQVTLAYGLALLAAFLIRIAFSEPEPDSLKVRTAGDAVQRAATVIQKTGVIRKIATIELIKGVQPDKADWGTWHVQVVIAPHGSKKNVGAGNRRCLYCGRLRRDEHRPTPVNASERPKR